MGMGVLGAEGRCAGRWGWACGAGAGGGAGAGAAGPCVIPRVGRGGWRQPGTQGSSFYPWSPGYEGDTGAAEGRSEEVPPFANFVTPWRWQSGSSLKNTIQKFLCKGTTSGSQDSAKDALAFQSLQFLSLPKLLKSVLGPAGTSPSCALLPLISRSACELGSSSSAGQGGPSKHSPPASAPTRRTRTGTQAHRHPPTGTHRAHTEHTPNTPHAHSHRDADTHTLSGVSLREGHAAGRSGLPELVMCEQACSSEGCEPGAWPVYPDRWGLPHWRRVGGGASILHGRWPCVGPAP